MEWLAAGADWLPAPRFALPLIALPCSKWMDQQGLQERLPTQRELRRSGANTLSAKIDSHGGLAGGQGGSLAGSQMLGLDRCV